MVILTDRQFILADSILEMSVNEDKQFQWQNTATEPAEYSKWSIQVNYMPIGSAVIGNLRDCMTAIIQVGSKKEAEALFKDMVKQYREQRPDEVYLNKLMD